MRYFLYTQDSRGEKYLSKPRISRSFVRIFEVISNIYCTRCEKY
jgi:hypothetical protein